MPCGAVGSGPGPGQVDAWSILTHQTYLYVLPSQGQSVLSSQNSTNLRKTEVFFQRSEDSSGENPFLKKECIHEQQARKCGLLGFLKAFSISILKMLIE